MTLAALLADSSARAARKSAARAFTAWWRERPEWRAALDRLERRAADDASAVLAAVRPMLADVAWLHEGLARLATLARVDPLFEPPLTPLRDGRRSGLRLHAHPRVTLAAIRLPRMAPGEASGAATITLDGRESLVRFLAGGPAIDVFRRAPGGDAVTRVARARPGPAAILSSGADEAWAVTAAAADVILLQATAIGGAAPPLRSFDRASGAPVGAAAADGAAMRLQLMASLLRHLGRTDGAEALALVAREGPPHQRWHVARELAALDRAAARPLIAALAASDPHPEVRAAARLTLAKLAA